MSQEIGEYGYAHVGDYAYENELLHVVLLGHDPEKNCTGEGNELCYKKGQQKTCRIKTQGLSVSSGHADYGINTINVEEKGQEENKDFLLMFRLSDSLPKLPETFRKRMVYFFLIIHLLIGLQKRNCGDEPPQSCNSKGYDHGFL